MSGWNCEYEFDGTDTDGTKWYRCTVHEELAPSPDAPCAGYQEEPYMQTTPTEHPLVGKTIGSVRKMTQKELDAEGWSFTQGFEVVLELDDGGSIYAMQDPEGNGPGVMIHNDPDGTSYYLGGYEL